MILDATAGNRTMWLSKNQDSIIYIDLERKLEVKPTIYADHSSTPFFDKVFDSIFFDPPHGWGVGHPFYKYPDAKSFKEKWQGYGDIPRYYGWDKNKNQQELIVHLWRAQKEFARILKDDGLLWLKWNTQLISIRRVLAVFDYWKSMLELPVKAPTQTAGKSQTYWVCLTKEKRDYVQTTLS
jgi:hypothetical protein